MSVQQIQSSNMSIALFGLSGNPPTYLGGHAGIVKYLISTAKFDEIWILPVYRHSYASKRALELYDHRMEMCRLNFEEESTGACKVRVLSLERDVYLQLTKDVEDKSSIRMGTIDIVRWLLAHVSSSFSYTLILGTDTYNDLLKGKWKESEE